MFRVLLLALLLAIATASACGGGDFAPQRTRPAGPLPPDVQQLLEKVFTALESVDSYHISGSQTPEHDGFGAETFVIDVDGAVTYSSNSYPSGQEGQECVENTYPANDGGFTDCFIVPDDVADVYTEERVSTRTGEYFRSCEDDECVGWRFAPSDADPFGHGKNPAVDPALNFVGRLMSVGEHLEVSESDGAVKIKGTYNPMTFWVEGAYTLYESLSDEERQEMCESSLIVTPPKGIPTSSPTPTPTRAPDCTGFTRDDFLHANEAVIASYARGAYPMEIWINPSDDTVQRLSYWDTQEQANWPGLEPLSLGSLEDLRYVVIEFSGYGEITVEIPELDLD